MRTLAARFAPLASASLLVVSLAACRSASSDRAPDAAAAVTSEAHAAPEHAPHAVVGTDPGGAGDGTPLHARSGDELAAFAGGCFWGTEDLFRQVPGVVATAVGYTGGHTEHPTYPQVCTHTTGHAETVLVEFDPKRVTYAQLLDVFFKNHNPTTMNRQGPDVGDQYRSEVFTLDARQAQDAKEAIGRAEARLGKHVVTRVSGLGPFYMAESYHQQYDERTGTHSCPIGLPTDGT